MTKMTPAQLRQYVRQHGLPTADNWGDLKKMKLVGLWYSVHPRIYVVKDKRTERLYVLRDAIARDAEDLHLIGAKKFQWPKRNYLRRNDPWTGTYP